ncbi:MAG: carboxymuconolactone decarboxylase family protein [SAR324 cluster bacterium]|nr:carboxymuconolactone decarboxylase family protein [SAR324 cluster bacterium]
MEISEEEFEAIENDDQTSDFFTPSEKAAMRWAQVLTEKGYHGEPGRPPVSKDAMKEMKKHFNDAQIVEISMVSGFFNFWNRFTDILEVDIEEGKPMDSFTKSTKINPEDYVAYLRECWWNEKQSD